MSVITHIVLLQPRADVSDDEMAVLLQRVKALRESVPGIVSIYTGKNKSVYHRGYTYGIIMHFIDEAHLEAHHSHPDHVAVVEELDGLCEQSIDFDL